MSLPDRQALRGVALGSRAPRRRLVALVTAFLALLTLALVGNQYAPGFGIPLLGAALLVTVLAGAVRAGVLSAVGAVFAVVLWRFLVPTYVGYVRGSWAERYAVPRMAAYEQPPLAEFQEGLRRGPLTAFVLAVVLGPVCYGVGAALRRAWRAVVAR